MTKNEYSLDLYFENVDTKPHVVSEEWLQKFYFDEDGNKEAAFEGYCSNCDTDVLSVGDLCPMCGEPMELGVGFSTDLVWPVSISYHDSNEPGVALLSHALENTGYALLHDADEGTYYLSKTDRGGHYDWGLALAYMRLHQFPPASLTLDFDDIRPYGRPVAPEWIWVAEGLYKSKMVLLNRLAYQAEDVAKLITRCKEA